MLHALFENITGANEDTRPRNGNVRDDEHTYDIVVLYQRAIRDTRKLSRDQEYALASRIGEARQYLIELLCECLPALKVIAVLSKRTTSSDNADSEDTTYSEELKLKILWRHYI